MALPILAAGGLAATVTAILRWATLFLIGSWIARIAGLITIYVISDTFVTYALGFIFDNLGQFSGIKLLELTGFGEAITVIASALSLRLVLSGFAITPGQAILGGGS